MIDKRQGVHCLLLGLAIGCTNIATAADEPGLGWHFYQEESQETEEDNEQHYSLESSNVDPTTLQSVLADQAYLTELGNA